MYDYVVAGAGSAGCVLAARLSEDPDVSVALIEARSPDTAPEIHVPAAFPALFKTGWDWDYDSEAEPELGGRRVYLPRGRMLGGSSSMNAMVDARGNAADYDGWAAGGARGWSYRDVLPYFIRSEDNQRGADGYHGAGGPLHVSDSRASSRVADAFVEAAVQAGYARNADFNGAAPFCSSTRAWEHRRSTAPWSLSAWSARKAGERSACGRPHPAPHPASGTITSSPRRTGAASSRACGRLWR
jgi:choline dehydrogenase